MKSPGSRPGTTRKKRAAEEIWSSENDFLNAPRRDLGDDELVGVAAVDLVDGAELLQLLAGLAELPEDGSVELHLVDLAGDVAVLREAVVGERVRYVEVLVRARRDADRPRAADVAIDGLESEV